MRADDVRAAMRAALTGSPDTPLVLVGNFEVEDQWARGEVGLPRPGGPAGGGAAQRMDEHVLLLAAPDDIVVLKGRPDDDYLRYLGELGLCVPRVLVPRRAEPDRTVTADVLADPELLAALSRAASDGYRLAPHGVCDLEEELGRRSGLSPAAPRAAICKRVNSKVYSRTVAAEHGLRQPAGRACRTLDELAAAFDWARGLVADGGRVVVKDAYGVSGKGLLVIRDARRFDQLWRLIGAAVRRSGRPRLGVVVEEWITRRLDLNYQITVDPRGNARLDFVKEALTDDGVHQGHRFPVALGREHAGQIAAAARTLARRLAADGYFGVAGMDAMVDEAGVLYPVVEINARNNMSTYQAVLHDRFVGAGRVALARHYPVRPARPLPFATLREALGDVLLPPGGGSGLIVTTFATVGGGRLHGLLVAGSPEELTALDARVAARLRSLGPRTADIHEAGKAGAR